MRLRDFFAAATVWSSADQLYDLALDRPRHTAIEIIIVAVLTIAGVYLAAALIDRAYRNQEEL